jgi:ABC-type multidrug transport system ATPase subunit
MAILEIKRLVKTFKQSKKQQAINNHNNPVITAVDHVSFTVKPGVVYGLLGPNGAGKTTTLRMISTLIEPDEGEIFVDEYSSLEHPYEVRKRIGFLTSELKLEDHFTPNYLFDYFSNLHKVSQKDREQRKEHLFTQLGIHAFKEVKVKSLSTGMKQKVSLAISLVHDPDVIIFDEPTNGLDVLTAKIVTDYLVQLKEAGKTIVLSTHLFDVVNRVCDVVGIIMNGKLVFEKSIDEVNQLEELFFELAGEHYER